MVVPTGSFDSPALRDRSHSRPGQAGFRLAAQTDASKTAQVRAQRGEGG